MEIDTDISQAQTSPANSTTQPLLDKNKPQQLSTESISSTVELSETSQLLSQPTKPGEQSGISKTQAQQAVNQVHQNVNDNPTLTFQAQSHKVTSELVANLIG